MPGSSTYNAERRPPLRLRTEVFAIAGVFGLLLAADIYLGRRLNAVAVSNALSSPNLVRMPEEFPRWRAGQDDPIAQEILSRLSPDDFVHRTYFETQPETRDNSLTSDVFIAFFGSARSSARPHSPADCLPGSGWVPIATETAQLPADPHPPITLTRLLLRKDAQTIRVYFWFQHGARSWGRESIARLQLVPAILSTGRSDLSLVRVSAPVDDIALPQVDEKLSRLAVNIHSSLALLLSPQAHQAQLETAPRFALSSPNY